MDQSNHESDGIAGEPATGDTVTHSKQDTNGPGSDDASNTPVPEDEGARPGDPLPGEEPQPRSVTEPAGDASASPEGLAPGDRIGRYAIDRVLETEESQRAYLAFTSPDETEPGASGDGLETPRACFVLFERAPHGFARMSRVTALTLRHPRLLAPREVFTHGGKEYLAIETLVDDEGNLPQSVADGARLDHQTTLAAGAGLADALGYLHRNGVAHLHVSPLSLVVFARRAYIAGMETADLAVSAADDVARLFAIDANFLARTLGVLAGVADEPVADEPPAAAYIRQIVRRGEANSYQSVEELAAGCAGGLQHTPELDLEIEQTQGRYHFVSAYASSVGNVRSENQDACACVTIDVFDDIATGMPVSVFLVADGMGGEARGEVASRMAVRTVPAEIARHFAIPMLMRPVDAVTSETPQTRILAGERLDASSALSRAVYEANRNIRLLAGMLNQTTGTTLTAIATLGGRAALAHLGDSRAYLLRDGVLTQLTEDHSVLARLQAIDHPLLSDPDVLVPRNMLYRSLGQEDDPNPDMLEFMLADGDRLLLCSDGLWDEVSDDLLAETLSKAKDPRWCAEQLVAFANAAGGHDNSTAVVVFIEATTQQEEASHSAGAADGRETVGDEESGEKVSPAGEP